MPDLRKRTMFVASGAVISNVAALVVAAILSRLLSKEVYGTYRQVFFVYRTLLAIMGLNLASSMLFFLPRSQSDLERKSFVGQSLLIGPAVGLVIGLVMLLSSRPIAAAMSNPTLTSLLIFLVPYAILNQVTILVPNSLIAADKAHLVLVYNLIQAIGRSTCIVLPFTMRMDIHWVIVSVVAWEFISAAVGICLLQKSVGISFAGIAWVNVRRQFSYTWPLLAAVIVGQLSLQFDKAVISVYFDTKKFAEYANGAIQIPFVMLVIISLSHSITPEMSKLAANGKTNQMLDLWRTAACKGAAFVFPVVGFFLLCPDYVMVLLYGPKYLISAVPFGIYCFALFLRIAYFGTILRAVGRNRLEIVAAAAALAVNVVITLVIVHFGRGTIWSFAGPAIGTVFGMAISTFVLIGLISHVTKRPVLRLIPIRHLFKTGLIMLFAAIPAFAMRWLPMPIPVKLPAMLLVFGAIYCVIARRFDVFTERDVNFAMGSLRRAANVFHKRPKRDD